MAQNQKMKRGPKVGTHHTEEHRANIDAAKLIKRLQMNALGQLEHEMTPGQIPILSGSRSPLRTSSMTSLASIVTTGSARSTSLKSVRSRSNRVGHNGEVLGSKDTAHLLLFFFDDFEKRSAWE